MSFKFLFSVLVFSGLQAMALAQDPTGLQMATFQGQQIAAIPVMDGGQVKVEDEKSCTLGFGWGHTHNASRRRDHHAGESWMVQGCNVGKAGGGELEGHGRFQRGPNGDWFAQPHNADRNRAANGGMMLFGLRPEITERKDYDEEMAIQTKHYLVGFVRLTQLNYLDLVDYAIKKLKKSESKCSTVRIKFQCVAYEDGDSYMGQEQLDRRLKVATTPLAIPGLEDNHGFSVLNRFESLGDCFTNVRGSARAYPEKCGQEIVVTPETRIEARCRDWVEAVKKDYPEWSWSGTTDDVAVPTASIYAKDGAIH